MIVPTIEFKGMMLKTHIFSGRFRMNEPPQYKVWKATLRNALHKHPHIKEVKEYGKSGLYRVYPIAGKINQRFFLTFYHM